MSEYIKCDRCNKMTKADSSGDRRYKIGVDGFDGYSTFHLCEWCLRSFYLEFLGWKWNDDECQYVPQAESEGTQMLRDDMKKYTELTGEDATHVPIIKLGAYLDGYEKGTEVLDKIRAEISEVYNDRPYDYNHSQRTELFCKVMKIIDKYKAEGSESDGNDD